MSSGTTLPHALALSAAGWAELGIAVLLLMLLGAVPTVIVLRDLRADRPDPGFEEPRRRG
jgi:hypothetical protein